MTTAIARKGLICTLLIVLAGMLLTPRTAEAQAFCVLYSFSGGTDGSVPYGGLVQLISPNTYLAGTTQTGGAYNNGGTVYAVKTSPCGQTTWRISAAK